MNECKNYHIPCPYALNAWNELPCVGSQEDCNMWREKYQKEKTAEQQTESSLEKDNLVKKLSE